MILPGRGTGGRKVTSCKAKTTPPSLRRLKARVSQLENEFDPTKWKRTAKGADEFFQYAYAPATLAQLLYLRETLNWKKSRVDNMISALALGSLPLGCSVTALPTSVTTSRSLTSVKLRIDWRCR